MPRIRAKKRYSARVGMCELRLSAVFMRNMTTVRALLMSMNLWRSEENTSKFVGEVEIAV